MDVSCKDNALVLKKAGKESIVDEVAGTVDIDPSILERRKKLSRVGRLFENYSFKRGNEFALLNEYLKHKMLDSLLGKKDFYENLHFST
ncbi:MAG: hypothetical protein WBA22_18160 [Candidatus Methanofastidiosia archaeon]